MITLGIETSCDETSVAVVKDGKSILSNVIYSSLKEHRPYGGVVPEIASRACYEIFLPCLDLAVKKAGISLKKVDLIAVTQGPGLMGSLLVGLSAAKALALALKKPLVGVDHVLAHLWAAKLVKGSMKFPCVGLVVSGGHTLLIRMTGPTEAQIMGRTIDDAAGEAFDKVAKMLNLGYPGGPEIDRLSRGCRKSRFKFKRPILSKDSLDFSFSGIKTAVLYKVEDLKKKKSLTQQSKREIAFEFQEALCEVLAEKAVRAARDGHSKVLVVGGGVSANRRLRECIGLRCRQEGAGMEAIFPTSELSQDNAAMVASLGEALYRDRGADSLDLGSYAHFMESRYFLGSKTNGK